MTPVDLLEFRALLSDLAAAYRKPMDERGFESYFEGLADLPLARVRDGMKLAKRDARYLPSVATIRACVRLDEGATSGTVRRPVLRAGEWCCTQRPCCDDTGWREETTILSVRAAGEMPAWAVKNLTPAKRDDLRATWGERIPLYPHGRTLTRVVPCPCRPDNAMYQWKRAQEHRSRAKGGWRRDE